MSLTALVLLIDMTNIFEKIISSNFVDWPLTKGGDAPLPVVEDADVNERALIWKMDLRICPVLVIVYIMAFIDR